MRHFGSDIVTVADQLTEAYVEVFSGPPWNHRHPADTVDFRRRLVEDAQRPGFRAILSFSDRGEVDGFVTGWPTRPPFRTDRAYGRVLDRLGPDRVEELLVGALEIDELGVRPRARGTGLGRRLLTAFTADAPEGRAWLLTWNQAHDTLAFYRRIGWPEPAPRPGRETDIVVFVSPSP
ncbi:GNAT family N-acetyltransferase [Plantactinospora sp. GCM10030261]|uniref:GNAT family N-acetyltransferase n=1 Tax=Plantactinospora sp. GCM10030261 TaxID=3273420 RepID=UPI00360B13C2